MESKIKNVVSRFKDLIQSDFVQFESVLTLKKIPGVYVFYNPSGELIYVGSTNNFHARFGKNLNRESSHTLVRKLIKSQEFSDKRDVKIFLMRDCKIKIVQCSNKREAEAVEHLAIFLLNPLYNN